MLNFYKIILDTNKYLTLAIFILAFLFFGYSSKDFKLDASSDTLILENDEDLKKYQEISDIYSTNEFLITTITSQQKIIKDENIQFIRNFVNDVESLAWVDSVQSILDAPLLTINNQSLTDLVNEISTLESENIDLIEAEYELLHSPIFKDLLISKNAKTTGVLINFKRNEKFEKLTDQRDQLKLKISLSDQEREELNLTNRLYEEEKIINDLNRSKNIAQIREIIREYEESYKLEFHLGGVPMIADDTISFVKNDIFIFGTGAFLFILIVLFLIFRRISWMIVCISNCIFILVLMTGLLSLIQWKVTVISSNFIMLILILSLSMTVHIVVRYKQILNDTVNLSTFSSITLCLQKMYKPCLYSALTTMFAFATLYTSGIKPVMDFGLMMSLGLICTYLISFTFLPHLMSLFNLRNEGKSQELNNTGLFANIVNYNLIVILSFLITFLIGLYGLTKLQIENSFIDYFKESTEIYQGMKLIDDQLGGTTPFDVIIQFNEIEEDYIEDDFLDFQIDYDPADYWFTQEKINLIKNIHDRIDQNQFTGKVLSLASVVRVAEQLNNETEFDTLELAVLYKKLPKDLKENILSPFVSIDHNQARISARLIDSDENLNRGEFVSELEQFIKEDFNNENYKVSVVGVLILYNNMLQSLFDSQISSLGIVMIGIFLMLIYLFRSLKIAIITMMPNIIACISILGIMGLSNIPLDLMTITIAAITIGIAVDNSIHYVYRYQEYRRSMLSKETIQNCSLTVAKAIRNTSVTIIAGFSILVFSNFYPTIYFGVFTAIAMLIALLGSLTLLPVLLNSFEKNN